MSQRRPNPTARSRRHGVRLHVERLEVRETPAGLVNGDFSVSDPASPLYGWVRAGGATVAGGRGVVAEGAAANSHLSQEFAVPPATTTLRFTIARAAFAANGTNSPPDAFEAALLGPNRASLVGTAAGLPDTDAFLNLQANGQLFFGPQVRVGGVAASGQTVDLRAPLTVTVDLSRVAAGTQGTLDFSLLGFAAAASTVDVDDADLEQGPAAPTLGLFLDPASDSAAVGDDLTNFSSVTLNADTDPGQAVTLDTDGDGTADATRTADASGRAVFAGVSLPQGVTAVRARAVNAAGAAAAERAVTVDGQLPAGTLVAPSPGGTVTSAPAFVEIRWADAGAAGVNESTFGAADVTVNGAAVERAEPQAGGTVRYVLPAGASLPAGPVRVALAAGAVADRAGNLSPAADFAFTLSPPPPAVNRAPQAAADRYAVRAGEALAVVAAGVLLNDADPEGAALTAALVAGTANGSLVLRPDGGFDYTPRPGFSGEDTFTYQASDGALASDPATVTLTVTPAPPPEVVPPVPPPAGPPAVPLVALAVTPEGGLVVPGVPGQPAGVRFVWTVREAWFNNEVALFRATGPGGEVDGVRPGDPGYTQAVLAGGHVEVVFAAGSGAGAVRDLTLTAGETVQFLIAQNRTVAQVRAGDGQLYFTHAAGNRGGGSHAAYAAPQPGLAEYRFDDEGVDPDRDFNDVVFRATAVPTAPPVSPAGVLSAGEAGPALTTFDLIATDAVDKNEVGFVRVDDAAGRVGADLPGDSNYPFAALAADRRVPLFGRGAEAFASRAERLPAGSHYALYLVPDGDAGDVLAGRRPVRFTIPQANATGRAATRTLGDGVFAFEDGGDDDFNDAVVRVGGVPQ